MGIFDFWRREQPAPPVASSAPRTNKRTYAAAQQKARYGDFRASRGNADYELIASLAEVRGKARYLGRNSPMMRRFIQLMRTNIVGPHGIRLQCRVKKLDGTMDTTLNTKVEAQFREWWAQPTVDGRMHGIDLLRQAVAQWCQDGEVLWELVSNSAYPDRLAIDAIEADHLDESLNTIYPPTGNQIRMSVEYDTRGRVVAYHLLTSHPGAAMWYQADTQRRYRRVLAADIIHLYDPERPKQSRGAPPAAAVINTVKMKDGYDEAVTVGRRLRASLMGFFYREQQGPAGIEELADREDETDDVLEMDMEPGRLKELPRGLRFDKFDPGGEQTDYAEFSQQQKKEIATGLGVSTMSLGMEVDGVSYSGGRTIVIEDRDYYMEMQQFFIRGLLEPMFKRWILMNSLSPTTDIPPSRMKAIVAAHVFQPRGWDWVDPAKDISANAEAILTGQTSLTRVLAARGIDLEDHLDEVSAERQAIADKRLTFDMASGNSGAKSAGSQNDSGSGNSDPSV